MRVEKDVLILIHKIVNGSFWIVRGFANKLLHLRYSIEKKMIKHKVNFYGWTDKGI